MTGRSGTRENSETALTGYKIAHPVISTSGARTAFAGVGVGVGRRLVYLAADDAVCLNNARHPVPNRMCKCGFYCLHSRDAARDLTSAPEHSGVVVIEVAASGRYRRHELGLRYARQRVRRVWLGRCPCGWAAEVFVETTEGRTGWRQLAPRCRSCARGHPVLTGDTFAALTGERGLAVATDDSSLRHFEHPRSDRVEVPITDDIERRGRSGSESDHRDRVHAANENAGALADAEFAVMHARIDELEARLDRLLHHE